jgi:hypothetical protein
VQVLQDIHAKRVDLYLHQQGIDTTTPSGKAMFQMLGVFAEFERAMIRERVMAGLARAKAEGTRLGRPAPSRMMQPRSKRSEPPSRWQEHPDHCTRAGSGHRDGFAPYGIERRLPCRENNSTISVVYRGTRAPTRPLAPPD